ncbi:MAG: methyltransferase [Pseudomonadota bacterium]
MSDFGTRVAARFDAAVAGYDAHSAAQRHAAQRLAERLAPLGLSPRPRVLEIGCGTGHLTALLALHLPGAAIRATDLAPAMVAACHARLGANPHLDFAVMDGRRPAGTDFFDVICGNLVAQWFDDLPGACARLAARLAPGGALLLSLPGGETFREWKAAHARLGLVPGTLPLPTPQACRAALPGNTHVDVEHWLDRPADGLAFLRSLRAIGADTAAPGHAPLPPAGLRRVLRELGPAPTLTYELIYLLHRAS